MDYYSNPFIGLARGILCYPLRTKQQQHNLSLVNIVTMGSASIIIIVIVIVSLLLNLVGGIRFVANETIQNYPINQYYDYGLSIFSLKCSVGRV